MRGASLVGVSSRASGGGAGHRRGGAVAVQSFHHQRRQRPNCCRLPMAGAGLAPCGLNARRMAYGCKPFAFAPLARGRMALPRGIPPRLSRLMPPMAHTRKPRVRRPLHGVPRNAQPGETRAGRRVPIRSAKARCKLNLAVSGPWVLTVARTQSVSWCFARSLYR